MCTCFDFKGVTEYKLHTITETKKPILDLIGIIISKLSDNSSEFKIAIELYDFIENPEFQLNLFS
jgi:hypothetical protein